MRQAANPDASQATAACRVCQSPFWPRTSLHALCSPKCAVKEAASKTKAERAERVRTRAQIDALRPRSYWLKLAQRAFNAYIRARDAHLPCISCGKAPGYTADAGHYLTTGARPELRFNEDNCHRQCVQCNQHLHGNLILYRMGLVARIGLERVETLEGPHEPAKLVGAELRALSKEYAAKARAATMERME